MRTEPSQHHRGVWRVIQTRSSSGTFGIAVLTEHHRAMPERPASMMTSDNRHQESDTPDVASVNRVLHGVYRSQKTPHLTMASHLTHALLLEATKSTTRVLKGSPQAGTAFQSTHRDWFEALVRCDHCAPDEVGAITARPRGTVTSHLRCNLEHKPCYGASS